VDAGSFLKQIRQHADRFYLIHYSSEALVDEGDTYSPRATSIVVIHYATRQTMSFALHTEAESRRIAKGDMEANYDDLEREMLRRFYEYIREQREKYWVHWHMNNLTYGFEHLAHRYRSLTGAEPPQIPIESRLNLNDILKERYGPEFAKPSRMKNPMILNGQVDKRFLDGVEERNAFKDKEFLRMHNSTISKVEFFHHVIGLLARGKLVTAGRGLIQLADCEFQAPQKCRRLIMVYAISFIP
jgi:hypothetical protein